MDTETLLIKLAEDNHRIIEHNFRYGVEIADVIDLIGHALEACTSDERIRIIQEIGLCWFAKEFETLAKGFPITQE